MKLTSFHNPHYYFLATDEVLQKDYSYTPFFFNSNKFFSQNEATGKTGFYIINKKNNIIEGKLNLSIYENTGYSPYKAPFGSLEFEKGLAPEIVLEFWQFLEAWTKDNRINLILIKSYPAIYHEENNAVVINTLISSGFKIKYAELNQHIEVSSRPYFDLISYSEIKRIKKCLKNNFRFYISPQDDLKDAYHIIKLTRDRKQYPTSMSFQQLENVFLKFPEHYLLFTVKDDEKIIALSVSILVNENILYNFYHAHDEAYDQFSPITMVVQEIYNYCQEQKIQILDLGISTDQNVLNKGLFRFKKNLGAKSSLKVTFEKNIA